MARSEQTPLILTVAEAGAGRLDQFLSKSMPSYSRSSLQNMIRSGLIQVNGSIVKTGFVLSPGDSISIQRPDRMQIAAVDSTIPDVPLDVLYEDEALIVINKQAGLTVHPGAGTHGQATVVSALIKHLGAEAHKLPGDPDRPGIVHRLDKDTSGVMVLAKSLEAHRHLAAQFRDKTNLREYVGILDGLLKQDELIVESYLYRDPRHRLRFASMSPEEHLIAIEEGREMKAYRYAKTFFSKRRVYGNRLTLATMRLATGRTHQIRVHARQLGCAILGDPIYANQLRLPAAFPAPLHAPLESLQKQMLHARRLGFVHPIDGRKLAFEAPLPSEFRAVLELLEKHCVEST